MPQKVYRINQAILRINKFHQMYLQAWYAWTKDQYGHWLDQHMKAQQMGVTYQAFSWQVYQARMKLLKLRNIWVI